MLFAHGNALVIGVSEYAFMREYNVAVAGRDAQSVAQVLQDPTRCAYPEAQVSLLAGKQATRAAILDELDALAGRLGAEDTLFLFFVGHGVYGTDGNYYLTCHDTRLQGRQVVAGTGVSEIDLLERLRKIKAQRMLLAINACHSGELSPSFDVGEQALGSEPPPQKLTDALLSSGEGRITISACRPAQKSWIGSGNLSLFSQALVSGLQGQAPNSQGYISAFGLYEYVYDEVSDAAGALGQTQEPELTVIKGVGPFPVALFRAAAQPGKFDLSEPAPQGTALREVSPEKSQRIYQRYSATLNGSGAIAQGNNAKAVGAGGVIVDGDFSGNLIVGGKNNRAKIVKD